MQKSFFKMKMCKHRVICKKCRCDDGYRKQISERYYVGEEKDKENFSCPHGLTCGSFDEADVWDMAKSFGKAVTGDAIEKLKGNKGKSDWSEAKLKICLSCEFIKPNEQCGLCKCFVRQKVKRTGKNAPCPVGKFEAILGNPENL